MRELLHSVLDYLWDYILFTELNTDLYEVVYASLSAHPSFPPHFFPPLPPLFAGSLSTLPVSSLQGILFPTCNTVWPMVSKPFQVVVETGGSFW